eukprot:5181889-Amphidinium_carterae.1
MRPSNCLLLAKDNALTNLTGLWQRVTGAGFSKGEDTKPAGAQTEQRGLPNAVTESGGHRASTPRLLFQ